VVTVGKQHTSDINPLGSGVDTVPPQQLNQLVFGVMYRFHLE
jgi:hypothetical protein